MSEHKWDEALIANLTRLADPKNPQRDVLAHLRRGLDRSPDYALARAGWLFAQIPRWALESALLVAGLFAWAKGNCRDERDTNFGKAFGSGVDATGKRQKRFIDLLDTDGDELPYKLRQAIALMDGTSLDWIKLIYDIKNWNEPERYVQKEWARGFWSHRKVEEADAENEDAITNAS
jgi:CRISPR system Cascade subunit CasB